MDFSKAIKQLEILTNKKIVLIESPVRKKGILKETFLNRTEDHLKNFIISFKSLFTNLKDFDKNHNIVFFKQLIKEDLSLYKSFLLKNNTKENLKRFKNKFKEFIEEIDEDLIEVLGLKDFVDEVLEVYSDKDSYDINNTKLEKVFDKYINVIEDKVEKVHKTFKSKIDDNSLYDPLINEAEVNKSKLSEEEFRNQRYLLQIELLKMQEWVKENGKRVAVVLEGRDASGKSSVIKMITRFLNPKNYKIVKLAWENKKDIPTDLWFAEYKKTLPEVGEIVLYDRSWYNRAVVEPIMGFCTKDQYEEFLKGVNSFEKEIISEDIILIKIWLAINKQTQKLRFELRVANPLKYWKYSENDDKALNKWDEFTKYINRMFKYSNSKTAPWSIIDANDSKVVKIDIVKKILKEVGYDKDMPYTKELINKKKETINKVIFLDLDGVMMPFTKGNKRQRENHFDEDNKWSKESINYLNQLTRATGAKIVVISSLRKIKTHTEIKNKFKEMGIKGEIIGFTPILENEYRGDEIFKWLSDYNVKNFVIIDDEEHHNIPDLFGDNYIKPKSDVGINEKKFNQALEILNS